MNKVEKYIERKTLYSESIKKNLVWQLSFEHVDWDYFEDTVNFARSLQSNIEDCERKIDALRNENLEALHGFVK